MKFEYLWEFVVLAEIQNYTKAAEELYISQTTLSRHIKEIEEELQVPLFARTTRKITLSEYGVLFLPYARQAVKLQEEYLAVIGERREKTREVLNVGTFSMDNAFGIAGMLEDYQTICKKVSINTLYGESEDLFISLQEGSCDFIFMRDLPSVKRDGFTRIYIGQDRLYVFMSKNHPLADRESIHISELSDSTFFLAASHCLSHCLAKEEARKAGFVPEILFSGSRNSILKLLKVSSGVALLFKDPILEDEQIVAIPLEPAVEASVYFTYGTKNKFRSSQKKFVNYIQEQFPLSSAEGE